MYKKERVLYMWIGVDLGFYQIKVANSREKYMFPSVVGRPSDVSIQNERQYGIENIEIGYSNEKYYVGKKAILEGLTQQLDFKANKVDEESEIVRYLAALSLLKGEPKEVKVATGLPVDEFSSMKQMKQQMIKKLKGFFVFEKAQTQTYVDVVDVVLIPQSAGAYYSYILNEDGEICEKRISPKTIVIDVGFRTTDIATMEYAKFIPSETFTIYHGVSNVYKEIKKILLKEYQLNKTIPQIDELVKQQSVYIHGEEVSLLPIIQKASEPLANQILSDLQLYLPNIQETHEIILCGGGAHLIEPFFQMIYGETIPIFSLQDPAFSNAIGYQRYAYFLEKQKEVLA